MEKKTPPLRGVEQFNRTWGCDNFCNGGEPNKGKPVDVCWNVRLNRLNPMIAMIHQTCRYTHMANHENQPFIMAGHPQK